MRRSARSARARSRRIPIRRAPPTTPTMRSTCHRSPENDRGPATPERAGTRAARGSAQGGRRPAAPATPYRPPELIPSRVAGAATAIRVGAARPPRAAAGARHAVRASRRTCARGGAGPDRPREGQAGAPPAPATARGTADNGRSPASCWPRAGRHTSERRRSRPSATRCTAPAPRLRATFAQR